jgi:pyruvate, orthophosphate dikinase
MTDAETLMGCLYIKGFGKTEALSEALGEPAEAVDAVLAELVASGNAEQTRVGARLSAQGKVLAQEKLAAERASVDHVRLEEEYERFTKLNADFKALVTDWQMREVDGKRTLNDHKDEAYDTAVLSRLAVVHALTAALIEDIFAHAPRVGAYQRRLASALGKIEAKDYRYVTAPDRDSYHTVWFELHQHLINLLGTTRAQEAAAGRAT